MPIANFAKSARKQTLRKSYAIDTGLAKMLSFTLSEDYSRLFETVVLNELKRRGHNLYYYKSGQECDFVIKSDNRVTEAIQVCYELTDSNREREINGLLKAMKHFGLDKGTLLTLEQQDKVDNVSTIPIVEWLLN